MTSMLWPLSQSLKSVKVNGECIFPVMSHMNPREVGLDCMGADTKTIGLRQFSSLAGHGESFDAAPRHSKHRV